MGQDVDKIISQLIKIVKFVSQQANLSFEERAATILQYHTLTYLQGQPEAKLGDVAKHLNASLSSTTQLIERMHKAGFITRVPDETDRRAIRLSLTEDGKENLQQMKQAKREKMKSLLSSLSKDEMKTLINLQEKLIANLK